MKALAYSCKFLLLAALLAAGTAAAGVGCQDRTPAANPKTLVVDSGSAGRVIAVDGAGVDTVSVKVFGNPSTGYQWVLVSVDGTSLEYVGQPHAEAASRNPDHAPGSDTYFMYYDLRVVGAGKTAVMLEYRGPGNGHPVGERFSATFDVHGKPATPPPPTTPPATQP